VPHRISVMLDACPNDLGAVDRNKLAECIAACFQCAQACTACVDACLGEDMVADLTTCIRTCPNCADICAATGNAVSRQTGTNAGITRAVLEACRQCETACKELLAALA